MAKIADVQEVSLDLLKPYERNAKKHGRDQIEKLKNSIEEFGFLTPCLIDADYNLIAGHGRVQAAQELGLRKVPCVFIEGLTEEQRRAYVLIDNKMSDLGFWDLGTLDAELFKIQEIDMGQFGFDIEEFTDRLVDGADFFQRENRHDTSREEGNDEYNEFLDKFEAKKTTDDCYTPELIYEAVVEWVENEYGVDRKNFVRPFYPGGDYQKHPYKPADIVVDNPPFSILAEILTWYKENGVRFFLFGPTLTLFSSSSSSCAIPVGVDVTYENGASVSTSFLTNLEDEGLRVRSAPTLYKTIEKANAEWVSGMRKELPKYTYPDEIITSAGVARYSKYGIDFSVRVDESYPCSALDSQKVEGKAIFGKGYLISEKAAAEKAAAEKAVAEKAAATRWPLSDREIEIVKSLGKGAVVNG